MLAATYLVSLPGLEAIAAAAERVALISIDGLTAEDVQRLDELNIETPVLDALIEKGLVAEGVLPTTPANTFPNHVTMITGTSAAAHGIFDNDRFAPGTESHGLFYHYYSDIRVPTLFDAARAAGLRTMAIWWPVTTGAPVDYLLADVPGDVRERGKFIAAASTPEMRQVLGNPDSIVLTDELRLDAAIAGLAGEPALMAIHFTELDAAQHQHGAGSAEAHAALERMDVILGNFISALEEQGLREGTAFVIASDHGFTPLHTGVFPGSLFRSLGLLNVDATGAVSDWKAYPWPGGVALAVYVNPELDDRESVLRDVDHAIRVLDEHPARFVHAVYRGDELRRWGGYPGAYALVNLKDGFAFGGDLDSALVKTGTSTKGAHGFVPDRPAALGALILSGAGIRRGASIDLVRMEDIAPTIAALLGIELPDANGRELGNAVEE